MARLSEAEILDRIRDQASVCRACAEDDNGATWPQGHEATGFYGKCGFCGHEKAVCCVTDWNWPRLNKQAQRKVSANREF